MTPEERDAIESGTLVEHQREEIERLRAAGQALLVAMWEEEYGNGYTTTGRAYKEAHAVFFANS